MNLITEYQKIYFPQKGPGAELFYGDCGPASIMQFRFLKSIRTRVPLVSDFTIDSMSKKILKPTKPGDPPDFAGIGDLIILGRYYDINFEPFKDFSIDQIKEEIDIQKKPVLALIIYGNLSSRKDKFAGGHFLTVVGYDDEKNEMILNCPLYGSPGWSVPTSEFERAHNPGENPYFYFMRQVLLWR